MGDPRVLLGKGTSARGTSNYGLWISKTGESVTTDGDDDLAFNSTLPDANISGTSVLNKYGEVAGVHSYGHKDISIASSGVGGTSTIATWNESDFTFNSTIYAPLCLCQIGTTSGSSPTAHWSAGTFYYSSTISRQRGITTYIYPKNRASDGTYDASGTKGALTASVNAHGAGTFRVYYAICYPYISQ